MIEGPRPVRTTLLLGGLGSLAFLLLGLVGARSSLWGWICFGIVWCLVTGYTLLLVRWSGRGLTAVALALLVLGILGALRPQSGLTFTTALAIFSWIRSGICYPRAAFPALLREVLLCGGGGLALALWQPSTPFSWALGIWLFSLFQALFFVLLEPGIRTAANPVSDPFEAARHRIEDLLEG